MNMTVREREKLLMSLPTGQGTVQSENSETIFSITVHKRVETGLFHHSFTISMFPFQFRALTANLIYLT